MCFSCLFGKRQKQDTRLQQRYRKHNNTSRSLSSNQINKKILSKDDKMEIHVILSDGEKEFTDPVQDVEEIIPNIKYSSSSKDQTMNVDRIRILHNTGQSVLSSLRCRARARLYLTSSHDGKKSITRVVDVEADREFPVYKVLRIHRHPHLMTYLGFCEDDGYRFYRYEYIKGKTLHHFIHTNYGMKPLPAEMLQQITLQSCLGLQYLHQNGLIHCDIKPDNMMVSSGGMLKIIDYDLSLFIGDDDYLSLHDVIGTTKYIPPECIHIKVYSRYTDMWSLGVMLYQLVTRELPFEHEINPYNFNFNLMRESSFKHPNLELLWNEINLHDYSPTLGNIIVKLLSYKDMERGGIDEILEHEWLKTETQSLKKFLDK